LPLAPLSSDVANPLVSYCSLDNGVRDRAMSLIGLSRVSLGKSVAGGGNEPRPPPGRGKICRKACLFSNRNIPTPRGGDLWNAMTVMRVMKRLGIAGK